MARAFLAFAGGLFEQALERRALHVHVHRRPFLLVNHGDDALEVDGIVKPRRGKVSGTNPEQQFPAA